MFNSLSDRLTATFKNLRGKGKLTEADIDATVREIRRALLDADVAVPVVREFTSHIKERALGAEVSEALNPSQQIVKIVNEELVNILGGQTRRINMAKTGPTIIMLAGLQGAGKTTLAGKLSHWLKKQGHTPMLVASDLQRPNAVNQLKVVGERAGVPVYAPHPGVTSEFDLPTGDPVQVARDGVAEARVKLHDVVIVDTAGRLGVDAELMQQARDIRDAIEPNEVLFVIDAMIGQDAVNAAKAFDDALDIDGVMLTKLDGDARGGAALSIRAVTGKPIKFAGTGEKLDNIEVFHPDRMASRILGMGDVLSLIEKAEQSLDAKKAAEQMERLRKNKFTLADFYDQLVQVKKMGSMQDIAAMLPGMNGKKLDFNVDEAGLSKIEAIIQSMTPYERENPSVLNSSRKKRIAAGSGTQVVDVNRLLKQFEAIQMLTRQFSNPKKAKGLLSRIKGMGLPF